MKVTIEHVAIYVKDLEGAKDFFVNFLDAKAGERYDNDKTGFQSYFLNFSDVCRLELMKKVDMIPSQTENKYTIEELNILTQPDIPSPTKVEAVAGYTHLAFSVGSKEMVDEVTEKMNAAGYPTASGPRVTEDGYYESCIIGPEGNIIELTN